MNKLLWVSIQTEACLGKLGSTGFSMNAIGLTESNTGTNKLLRVSIQTEACLGKLGSTGFSMNGISLTESTASSQF